MFNRILNNKHTSIAAGVYIAMIVVCKVGAIWFPQHSQQFVDTTNTIEKLAVSYGLLMAADSSPKPEKETDETPVK